MKKVFALILAALFLFSFACAEQEITFQNLPWLSDVEEAIRTIKDAGYLRDGADKIGLSNEKAVYITPNDDLNYQPTAFKEYKDYSYSVSLRDYVKGKLAGYPVADIDMAFAYDGQYKLIAVKIDLLNADYAALKEKLTKVYGEGEAKAIVEEGIETIIWKGENNSSVLLYTESEGLDYTLVYGRIDATEILANCLNSDPDDVSGL